MTRVSGAFCRWDEAFDYVRERNRPEIVLVDGQPYKLYPSGRSLCAATRPYHSFDGEACDCQSRESGGTILREVLP